MPDVRSLPFLVGVDSAAIISRIWVLIRNKAIQYGVPYFTASDLRGLRRRMPSESEIRMEIFSSMAAGYKGDRVLLL